MNLDSYIHTFKIWKLLIKNILYLQDYHLEQRDNPDILMTIVDPKKEDTYEEGLLLANWA